MKLVNAGYKILSPINGDRILKDIEKIGRTCYKSEAYITPESSISFINKLIFLGHESVLEHKSISVKFITDRGVSHEIVRHRLCSFSQESTRYINYTKENKGGQCTFVNMDHHFQNPLSEIRWVQHMFECEEMYKQLIDMGESPQIARSVLPNSLKTEIVVTANLREWRTIFKQRVVKAAHPQMREIMIPLLKEFKSKIPVIFDDINE